MQTLEMYASITNLSVVYDNDTVLGDVCLTILPENQIFLNEAKRKEMRK